MGTMHLTLIEEAFLYGIQNLGEHMVDKSVAAWHSSESNMTLAQWLGLSEEQYERWLCCKASMGQLYNEIVQYMSTVQWLVFVAGHRVDPEPYLFHKPPPIAHWLTCR